MHVTRRHSQNHAIADSNDCTAVPCNSTISPAACLESVVAPPRSQTTPVTPLRPGPLPHQECSIIQETPHQIRESVLPFTPTH